MDYVIPWSNLVSSVLLTIYSFEKETELEEFVLCDGQNDIERETYERVCNIFTFLRVTNDVFLLRNKLNTRVEERLKEGSAIALVARQYNFV